RKANSWPSTTAAAGTKPRASSTVPPGPAPTASLPRARTAGGPAPSRCRFASSTAPAAPCRRACRRGSRSSTRTGTGRSRSASGGGAARRWPTSANSTSTATASSPRRKSCGPCESVEPETAEKGDRQDLLVTPTTISLAMLRPLVLDILNLLVPPCVGALLLWGGRSLRRLPRALRVGSVVLAVAVVAGGAASLAGLLPDRV